MVLLIWNGDKLQKADMGELWNMYYRLRAEEYEEKGLQYRICG